jgi:hypothetical protein
VVKTVNIALQDRKFLGVNSSSRQTLVANLAQQASALILILVLPNILEKTAYAETVFVSVLLSFIVIADLGLSLVYGRIVPALVGQQDDRATRSWDASVLGFGLVSAAAFAIVIASIYMIKFGNLLQAALLLPLPIISYWISFHISRSTVRGDFAEYRRAISLRALSTLLCLPLAIKLGLFGWFWGQLAASLLVVAIFNKKLLEPVGAIEWKLMQGHLYEGLILCAVTALWLQLLNFARLYASLNYSSEIIANYGIVSSANQSLSTLLISAFLPVTVGVLRRFGESDEAALDYVIQVLKKCRLWIFSGTIIAIEAAPLLFGWLFPDYQLGFWEIFPLLLGIIYYPFFILWGNIFVGKRRFGLYLVIISLNLSISWVAAITIDIVFPGQGAAWGQLFGLITFPFNLLFAGKWLDSSPALSSIRRSWFLLWGITALAIVYGILHWGIEALNHAT